MDAPHSTLPATGISPGVVVITPVAEHAPSVVGTLTSMTVGLGGLAVHVEAEVADVAALVSERVWVMTRDDERLLAFQAVARASRTSRVELSGVTAPVEERRRTLVRSPAVLDIALYAGAEDTTPLRGRTVDLSRGGCRLRLSTGELPAPGQRLRLALELEREEVSVDSFVHRVDQDTGEIVLRFDAVPLQVTAALDREVLSRVL
ncbi:MAG: PilZ domain-containing protein [Actinomycetes bacterium]